jgi:hypothetical protein
VRREWLLVFVGVIGLASLRIAYTFTFEPAPAVRVKWQIGTGEWRRAWLEMKYRLEDPEAPQGTSYAYVLFDTSQRNIKALVADPEAADTNDIDRDKFEVPWARLQETRRFMWVADRIPVLRQPIVRRSLMVILGAMTLIGARGLLRALAQAPNAD